jgi:murein DD-endopeptidase MepM/ murein hydrolase activator NlpD
MKKLLFGIILLLLFSPIQTPASALPRVGGPEPAAVLSTYTPYQGQIMGFTMTGFSPDAAYELADTHFTEPVIPFALEDKLVALIPVTAGTSIGLHNLDVVEIIGGERSILFTLQYHVQKVEFTRQNLRATTEMSALYTNENIRSDREKRLAATAETAPAPLWDGLFVQPVEGRISTQFGQMRYTNGTFTSRHAAIDIAAPAGTPIIAAAGGRIVLAEDLIVSGKAVIIDHGLWLFTYYYHLHEISVQAGDEVQAGDVIGTVGTTGYSTGPHLHYAAIIKGSAVNPDYLKEINPLP